MGSKNKQGRKVDGNQVFDIPTDQRNQQDGPVLDQVRFATKLQIRVAQQAVDIEAKDAVIEQLWEENQQLKKQVDDIAGRIGQLEKGEKSGLEDSN